MMATKNRPTQIKSTKNTNFLPWVEKYRPKTVSDVASQEEVVNILKRSLETKDLPHMIFHGPPGTGKTSAILAIAQQIFGPDHYKRRVKELNASDDRGIKTVRKNIKTFAEIDVSHEEDLPPYKLIILDEADSMTDEAQSALRRMIETYSTGTRFCLLCNYVSKIIDPIVSRCAQFRFKSISNETMEGRLKYICKNENIKLTSELSTTLFNVSNGDLRKAITLLQSAHSLNGTNIQVKDIEEVAGKVPDSILESLFETCRIGTFDQVQAIIDDVLAQAYPANQITSQLFSFIVETDILSNITKSNISEQIAITDKLLLDGSSEYLQLITLFAFVTKELQLHK